MTKPSKPGIPPEAAQEVRQIVEDFNRKQQESYQVSFRGQFCYLSRMDDRRHEATAMAWAAKMLGFSGTPQKGHLANVVTEIGRLKWGGDMKSWDFAVYKYSRDGYDPDEFWFPGSEKLNGTILGALSAGREIYP